MSAFDEVLKEIANLREQKGREHETLELIDKTEAEAKSQNEDETRVKLYWEKSLVWQHIAMNEESQETPHKLKFDDAVNKMQIAIIKADEIIDKHNIERLRPMSYRHIGQMYRYKKDYEKSAQAYIKSINEYEKTQSVTALELKGFLSAVLVAQGKVEEGIALAVETFKSFDTKKEALELKEKDYFTWAVWKSGIIPRILRALEETNATYNKEEMGKYLDQSEDILKNPTGKITWGDSGFKLRLDEIAKARTLLSLLILVGGTIIGYVFN